MSEANDGPGGATVVVIPSGEGPPIAIGEGGEIQDAGATAVEEVADAAVQIAAIEADRDVTLAVIHQEGEAEWAERRNSEEVTECRLRIAELEGANAALQLELSNRPQLTPVLLVEEPLSPAPPLESGAEDGPRESPVVEAVEAVEEAPEPPPRKHKTHRWI